MRAGAFTTRARNLCADLRNALFFVLPICNVALHTNAHFRSMLTVGGILFFLSGSASCSKGVDKTVTHQNAAEDAPQKCYTLPFVMDHKSIPFTDINILLDASTAMQQRCQQFAKKPSLFAFSNFSNFISNFSWRSSKTTFNSLVFRLLSKLSNQMALSKHDAKGLFTILGGRG